MQWHWITECVCVIRNTHLRTVVHHWNCYKANLKGLTYPEPLNPEKKQTRGGQTGRLEDMSAHKTNRRSGVLVCRQHPSLSYSHWAKLKHEHATKHQFISNSRDLDSRIKEKLGTFFLTMLYVTNGRNTSPCCILYWSRNLSSPSAKSAVFLALVPSFNLYTDTVWSKEKLQCGKNFQVT